MRVVARQHEHRRRLQPREIGEGDQQRQQVRLAARREAAEVQDDALMGVDGQGSPQLGAVGAHEVGGLDAQGQHRRAHARAGRLDAGLGQAPFDRLLELDDRLAARGAGTHERVERFDRTQIELEHRRHLVRRVDRMDDGGDRRARTAQQPADAQHPDHRLERRGQHEAVRSGHLPQLVLGQRSDPSGVRGEQLRAPGIVGASPRIVGDVDRVHGAVPHERLEESGDVDGRPRDADRRRPLVLLRLRIPGHERKVDGVHEEISGSASLNRRESIRYRRSFARSVL